MKKISATPLLLLLFLSTSAFAATEKYTAAEAARGEITAEILVPLLPETPRGLGAPAGDRHYWFDTLGKYFRNPEPIYERARQTAADFTPDFSDECWLDRRNFARYGGEISRSAELLQRLTAAECLENKGNFLPEIARRIDQLCSLKTWVTFHHDRDGYAFSGKGRFCDLLASDLGRTLAEIDFLLGDGLPESTRKNIRSAVNAWLFEPYLGSMRAGKPLSGMWWIESGNNWNAVCNYNVAAAAAILIESREQRAELLAFALESVQRYLNAFSDDGYCSEGVSYWNYGFSHYLSLAELFYCQTGGTVNLFSGTAKLDAISRFGLRCDMSEKLYPAFADSPTTIYLKYPLTVLLERRTGLTAYARYSRHPAGTIPTWNAGELLLVKTALDMPKTASSDGEASSQESAGQHLFPDAGVVISRPAAPNGLFLAFKAGTNAEFHNHNDIGSFVAGIDNTPILTDPGYPEYTADSFTLRRYESDANNSFGHPVPVVNGYLQGSCGEFGPPDAPLYYGTILEHEFTGDSTRALIDLKPAYPTECGIKTLTREFLHVRQNQERVVMTDCFELETPGRFGGALTTYAGIRELGEGEYEFATGGNTVLHASIRAEGGKLRFNRQSLKSRFIQHDQPSVRLGFEFAEPIQSGRIIVEIQPKGN